MGNTRIVQVHLPENVKYDNSRVLRHVRILRGDKKEERMKVEMIGYGERRSMLAKVVTTVLPNRTKVEGCFDILSRVESAFARDDSIAFAMGGSEIPECMKNVVVHNSVLIKDGVSV